MNIYLLEQDINTGYDTYDSCVVIAENEQEARDIHPSDFVTHISETSWMGMYSGGGEYRQDESGWVGFYDRDKIKITFIGKAMPGSLPGVVCASFNAG